MKFFLISIFFLSTGCVTLYKPNTINSPLLKEKGDANITGAIGIDGSGLYNLQTAYAVSNHVGLLLNGMYHIRVATSSDNSVDKWQIPFGEIGAGYFSRFGKNKTGVFQCYSGIGLGTTSDKIENSSQSYPEVSADFTNAFIQPGVAFTEERVNIAFDVRVNYVRLYNINAYLYENFEWWNTDYIYSSGASLDFVNLEPAMTIQAGGNKLKAVLQLGLIIPAINAKSYFDVNSSSYFIGPLFKTSIGINYAFGKNSKTKSKSSQ